MSGTYTTSGTQIMHNGVAWSGKGVAIFSWPNQATVAGLSTLRAQFPKIKIIRVAACSGHTNNPCYNNTPDTVASLSPFIDAAIAANIVVVIEDHTAYIDPCTLSGAALADECAWYASFAAAYKNKPHVWFGTMNEPLNSANPSAIQAQELAIYNAIRNTGNNSIIALEMSGGNGVSFAQPSAYAPLENVVWDFHAYGLDVPGASTDPATINAALKGYMDAAQAVKMAPIVILEYGPATTQNVDPNAQQLIAAVQNLYGPGLAKRARGVTGWCWGGSGNDWMGGPGALNAWGQQNAAWIG